MDNNKHIRLDRRDCIDKDTMIRYVNDQLSAREKHQVEKHAMDCALCSEAMEGLMAMKDRSALKGILEKIDRRVMGHEEKKTGPAILWMDTRVRVAVAAGAALLIGCIWFFNRNLNDAGADKTVSQTLPVTHEPVAPTDNPRTDSTKNDQQHVTGPTSTTVTGKEDEFKKEDKVTGTAGAGGKTDKDGDQVPDEKGPKFNLTPTNRKDSKVPADTRSKQTDDLKKSGDLSSKDLEHVNQGNVNGELNEVTQTDENQKVLNDITVIENDKTKEEQEIVSTSKKDKKKPSEDGKDDADKSPQPKSNSGGNYGFVSVPQSTNAPVQEKNNTVNNNTQVTYNDTKEQQSDYYKNNGQDTGKVTVTMLDSMSRTETSGGDQVNKPKDYSGEETRFRQQLKKDPNNREALYSLGVNLLDQDKPALAIEQFDKVIALGKGAYYDESRYKKSEALVKQGKKTEAKKILDELIKENGPLKPKAVDLEKK
jgi:hypothetical protein